MNSLLATELRVRGRDSDAVQTHFLGAVAVNALQIIQRDGGLLGGLPEGLTPDERLYLRGELGFRSGDYFLGREPSASAWVERLVQCMGHLFTAPIEGLKDLDWLEPRCMWPMLSYRLKVWRMHINLVVGYDSIGLKVRREVEAWPLPERYLWTAESSTLLAVSYFSLCETKTSIKMHRSCLESMAESPEVYFQTLGAALAMRAALKVADAESFELFSMKLDEGLALQPDNRYELRQHGYRAMVLTQLGEAKLAGKYWSDGDRLLAEVDSGVATLERAQYLTLRCLAAALLSDINGVAAAYRMAEQELAGSGVFALHMAELDICRLVAPLANSAVRSKNIKRTHDSALEAIECCRRHEEAETLESVRVCYQECREVRFSVQMRECLRFAVCW